MFKKLDLSSTSWLLLLAVIAVMLTTIFPVWSYFTDTAQAESEWIVKTEYQTELIEDVEGYVKHVSIKNLEDSAKVFVRVQAFAPEGYSLIYSSKTTDWDSGGDGWWYFSNPIEAGDDSSVLDINIRNANGTVITPGALERDFNVIVVYEATVARPYGGWHAEWDDKMNVRRRMVP